jgi:hypothetical protein
MTNSQLATILNLNNSINPGNSKTVKGKRKSVAQMNPHALYGPKANQNMSPLLKSTTSSIKQNKVSKARKQSMNKAQIANSQTSNLPIAILAK